MTARRTALASWLAVAAGVAMLSIASVLVWASGASAAAVVDALCDPPWGVAAPPGGSLAQTGGVALGLLVTVGALLITVGLWLRWSMRRAAAPTSSAV